MSSASSFEVVKTCPGTRARAGLLITPHGAVPTPAFLPLASKGTVKTLSPDELHSIGTRVILGNTYHLYLRPGVEVIKKVGGLHRFMAWEGPILTDSGGFQVVSLAHLRRVTDEGVVFRSHIDGSEHFFTPELSVEVQEALGADLIMAFDECPPYSKEIRPVREAMRRTHGWAERCLKRHQRQDQALFGIVQGGIFPELRRESVEFLRGLDFPGYAIGGLSVGEPKELTYSVAEQTAAWLPADKPRYLMGVGSPEDLVECVAYGIDLFDCALPTRIARNGALLTRRRRINLRNASFKALDEPIDPGCDCYTCHHFSAAYLHHLFKSEEMLGYRLATIHNLRFIIRLMEEIRQSILEGNFPQFRENFLRHYQPVDEEMRREQKQRWLNSLRRRAMADD